jgi:hypothetical protein
VELDLQDTTEQLKEALHPRIADTVWQVFMRGEYDVAAFQTMKAVEVFVLEASGLGADLLGVKLMRAAFAPESGPLTDSTMEGGERVDEWNCSPARLRPIKIRIRIVTLISMILRKRSRSLCSATTCFELWMREPHHGRFDSD